MWKRKVPKQEQEVPEGVTPPGEDIRPIVRLPRRGLSSGALILGGALAAVLLFSTLNARRRGTEEPSIWSGLSSVGPAIADPPPLQTSPIAPAFVPAALANAPPPSSTPPTPPSREAIRAYYDRAPPVSPPPQYYPPPAQPTPAVSQAPRNSAGAALVIDNTISNAGGDTAAVSGGSQASLSSSASGPARVRSSMLANKAATVPQGTLIPAVLETAFDSTRPGFARAIVSRDVRGFDGSKVLISRGSSLVGQYQSDVAPGQKRAIISWTRLLRPDGVTIELDSPAVDPVGRGGVRASVNNHIPQRILSAVLQSSFEIGTLLATRAVSGSVILALPTSLQGSMAASPQATQIMPTLKVPAGTSISIFVARDLEFGSETQE